MTTVLDDTFYPILLLQVEEPFAPGELDAYVERLSKVADRALAEGVRMVAIVKNERVSTTAAGRSAVAEAHKKHLSQAQTEATALSLIVLRSALERGVLTAFRWILPDTVRSLRAVASMEEAYDEAMRGLERLGQPFTGDREALRAALGLNGAGARAARRSR